MAEPTLRKARDHFASIPTSDLNLSPTMIFCLPCPELRSSAPLSELGESAHQPGTELRGAERFLCSLLGLLQQLSERKRLLG